MSAEKRLLKQLNKFVEEHDIPKGKVGYLMGLAVRYSQELEHIKQSESKKPQEQRVDEIMLKNQLRLDGWVGWLQARIPELKKGANECWIKQALRSYKDAHVQYIQPDQLKEAAEKVVEIHNEKVERGFIDDQFSILKQALDELEKALK